LIPKDLIKNNVVPAKFLQLPEGPESPNYKLLTASNYKLLTAANYKLLTDGKDSNLNESDINNKLIKE